MTNRISNPLADISFGDLMRDVEFFVEEKGMHDKVHLLKKGALVAQDPARFDELAILDSSEKEVLRREVASRWRHPLRLYLTIIVCSIGAAVQGWDQTGSNGANLSFPKEFGIGHGEDKPSPNYHRDSWLVGMVNAGPYLGSAFIGCWLSDPCNYYFVSLGGLLVLPSLTTNLRRAGAGPSSSLLSFACSHQLVAL